MVGINVSYRMVSVLSFVGSGFGGLFNGMGLVFVDNMINIVMIIIIW